MSKKNIKKWKPKTAKKKLTNLCRKYVRLRDKNTCQWCRKKIYGSNSHPHHIVARSLCGNAGKWDVQNFMLLCFHCHYKIKNEPDEYIKFRDAWLLKNGLSYQLLRSQYRGALVRFNKEVYELYKKVLEEMIGELR